MALDEPFQIVSEWTSPLYIFMHAAVCLAHIYPTNLPDHTVAYIDLHLLDIQIDIYTSICEPQLLLESNINQYVYHRERVDASCTTDLD